MSTTTTYLELTDQATGENSGTWGDVTDTNLQLLELAIARRQSISTTGGTTTFTSAQNRYPICVITGVLASNAVIEVKAQEKNWIFINQTTGNFTVQVKTPSGTGVIIPRRRAVKLYCDGTNVNAARYTGMPQLTAGGTADAMTGNFYPEPVSGDLTDEFFVVVECVGANTVTNPTFNPNSIGNKTIYRYGGAALKVGDIPGASYRAILNYNTTLGGFVLLNPAVNDTLLSVGTDITDGATINIPGVGGYFKLITSTTAITAFSITNNFSGRRFVVEFDTARTLTHNATSLILPSGANITTAQGDKAEFVVSSAASNNVKCISYQKATGGGVIQAWEALGTVTASTSASIEATGLSAFRAVRVTFHGVNLVTATTRLRFQLYDGASYVTASYAGHQMEVSSAAAVNSVAVQNGGDINAQAVAANGGDFNGQFIVTGLNTTAKKAIMGQFEYTSSVPTDFSVVYNGYNKTASAMSGVRFISSSGNILSGTFVFEGLR